MTHFRQLNAPHSLYTAKQDKRPGKLYWPKQRRANNAQRPSNFDS